MNAQAQARAARLSFYIGIALMVAVPFLFYPFALGFWLANDIWIRPVTEEEMRWHRASRPGEFRSFRDR